MKSGAERTSLLLTFPLILQEVERVFFISNKVQSVTLAINQIKRGTARTAFHGEKKQVIIQR